MRVGSRRSLAWRVFLTNAAILVGVSAFYVASPATISSPVTPWELLVLVIAIVVSLFLNLILLERAFAPLEQLRRLMERVDPLTPGARAELRRPDADVAALADAFNQMLDHVETERRESARRALAAQEDERLRVARDLHDELGQRMTGVLLLIDEASRAEDGRAIEAFSEAREAARSSIDEVRRIVRDLRPEALDDLGLVSALNSIAAGFERQTGVDLECWLAPDLPALTPEQELVVYRISQEALTNVARHAHAGRAGFTVDCDDRYVHVVVRDDGRGFEGGMPDDGGIRGMHERALLVRGVVTVRSAPGRGTEVSLRLPIEGP